MEPGEFQYYAQGLSETYMIAIISAATVLLFIYMLYLSKKKGIGFIDGKYRPLKFALRSIKENGSTITAVVSKNLIGKYNNSYFGILWNFISPLLLVIAIYFIFINIKGVYPDRHYWSYIISGTFVVTMCRQALSGTSFRGNSPVIKKLPSPSWSIALGDTISNFITCIIPVVFLTILALCTGVTYDYGLLLYAPLLFIILFVFCFGLTMLFSTLTVLAGDLRQLMVTVSRVIIWVSPVFFYLCDARSELYTATMWNPFTYTVEPFHQIMSYGVTPDMTLIGMSVLIALFFLVLGTVTYLLKFNRVRELI